MKGRKKLARLDNNEETDDKEASRQLVREENRASGVKSENDENEIVVMVKHSAPENENLQEVSKREERAKNTEEPFVSSIAEEDLANKEWDQLSRKAEERSYRDEGEVGRDYYPSGPRREQLLHNERAFSTSAEEGDLHQ